MMSLQNFGFFIMFMSVWLATPEAEVCAETRFAEAYMALTCFLVAFLCVGMGFGGYPGTGTFMPYPNGLGMGMGPGVTMGPGMGANPQAAFAGLAGYPAAQRGPQPQMQPTPTVISGRPVEGAPDWAAYTAPDGRTYYYNAKTGVSSWEKPGQTQQVGVLGSFGY